MTRDQVRMELVLSRNKKIYTFPEIRCTGNIPFLMRRICDDRLHIIHSLHLSILQHETVISFCCKIGDCILRLLLQNFLIMLRLPLLQAIKTLCGLLFRTMQVLQHFFFVLSDCVCCCKRAKPEALGSPFPGPSW